MRVFKLLLWLAAWSVWAWLGVGLHRELARDLGQKVCEIPVNRRAAALLGFVGKSNRIAVTEVARPFQSTALKVFDAETGKFERNYQFESASSGFAGLGLKHGWAFANERWVASQNGYMKGIHRLDLASGEWKRLTDRRAVKAWMHDEKPWLLVAENSDGRSDLLQVVVLDARDGQELFSLHTDHDYSIDGAPFFIPETDDVVVPTTLLAKSRFEIWKIADPPVLERTVKAIHLIQSPSVSATGRIAVPQWDDRTVVQVYDLNEERIVFTRPAGIPPSASNGPYESALGYISRNGKRLIAGDPFPTAVWDVDAGAVIWQPGPGEFSNFAHNDLEFDVTENWTGWWMKWLPKLRFRSLAYRSLQTGEVRLRLKGVDGGLLFNHDETLAATSDGAVHRMPFRTDWRLLGGCQAVLASPLVMLWAVLRWRRKRRRQKSWSRGP